MSATNKIIWTLGLLVAFLLILITGQTNLRNFENVQTSIEEIYKDRLVVKGLIFDLSTLLHRKEVATLTGDQAFYAVTNESVNAQIDERIRAFRATKLTPYEATTLDRFEKEVKYLKETEFKIGMAKGFKLTQSQSKDIADHMSVLKEDLKTLSSIQLREGKRKKNISDKAVSSMMTFARAENYILIIFAVLMLMIIFVVPGPKEE